MLVTLRNTATITLDLAVESVSWVLPGAREVGEATVELPLESPAFDTAYVDRKGGSLITLHDAALGTWPGVVRTVEVSAAGARLSCQHLTAWTSIRPVALNRVFENHTAGAIARVGVLDAVAGLGRSVLVAGTFVEAAPVLPRYEFRGQMLSEVLGDLADQTGQEWTVSDAGVISWLPRTGTLYARLLAEAGDLAESRGVKDVTSRLVAVRVRDQYGRESRAVSAELAATTAWQREDVIGESTANAALAALAAERHLAGRRGSAETYSFKLRRRPLDFVE